MKRPISKSHNVQYTNGPLHNISLKTFVTEVLLRRATLRGFAEAGFKLVLCALFALIAVAVVHRLRGETWLRSDTYDLLGGLIGIIVAWLVSAVYTISTSYHKFRKINENH